MKMDSHNHLLTRHSSWYLQIQKTVKIHCIFFKNEAESFKIFSSIQNSLENSFEKKN